MVGEACRSIIPNMKKILLALFCFSGTLSFAQTKTISGYVSDSQTGEALIGVNLWSPDLKLGTATNVYGFYSFNTSGGQARSASHISRVCESRF